MDMLNVSLIYVMVQPQTTRAQTAVLESVEQVCPEFPSNNCSFLLHGAECTIMLRNRSSLVVMVVQRCMHEGKRHPHHPSSTNQSKDPLDSFVRHIQPQTLTSND